MIKGERLKKLRISKNLTQEQLGKVLGVTKASICCYEKGTRTPTLETLLDIVEFFGVSADYVLGTDIFVSIENKEKKNYLMTKEEIRFIEELRKNKD